MTRDDVIRWARSAIRLSADGTNLMGFDQEKTILDRYEFLCWFASNVATDVRKEEREACAVYLEHGIDLGGLAEHPGWQRYTADLLAGCAAGIRARSNVQQEPQK